MCIDIAILGFNMNMLELVDAYLQDAGLYDGWTSQLQFWNDTGDGSEQFIVLQSNGGTQVMDSLGGDFYFWLLCLKTYQDDSFSHASLPWLSIFPCTCKN